MEGHVLVEGDLHDSSDLASTVDGVDVNICNILYASAQVLIEVNLGSVYLVGRLGVVTVVNKDEVDGDGLSEVHLPPLSPLGLGVGGCSSRPEPVDVSVNCPLGDALVSGGTLFRLLVAGEKV